MERLKFLFIAMALSAFLAGCMSAEPSSGPQDDQAQDSIYFLRQKPSDAPSLLAPLEGKLVLSEACLCIQSGDGGADYTALWPFEFSLAVQGDSIQILNGDKLVVARVGDQIRVSGGQANLSPEEFEANVIGTATQCTAHYWRINNDVEVVAP